MTGHVIVDDVDSEGSGPWRPSSAGLAGLATVVLVTLVLLPGGRKAEVTPTTVTLPQVAVAEDRWTRLDLPGAGPLTDVAATDSGVHVAVGFGPQFWWSADGMAWEWGPVTVEGPGRVAAVESLGDGAVAVGAVGVDETSGVATVWTSADGRAWKEVAVTTPVTSGLEDVRSTDDGLVAWGWQGDPGIFDPGTDSLLLTSEDGSRWETVPSPSEGARLFTVDWTGSRWLAGGIDAGRPAAWSSPDLRNWERIPTDGMPFGWVMTEIGPDEESLVAEITDQGSGRTLRWVWARADGTWQNHDLAVSGPTAFIDGDWGVGSGRLWVKEDEEWTPIDTGGSVEAIAGAVAVGEVDSQPSLWLRDVTAEPTAEAAAVGDGRWAVIDDLGEGALGGAWPVGDGWLVGVSRQWWLVDDRGVETVAFVDNPPARVTAVGDEWLALPSLHWGTADGRSWEQRSEPWAGALEAGPATVWAASEVDGALRVVGTDTDWHWVIGESHDGGRSWQPVGEPAFPSPIWDMAGIPTGFAATVARRGASRDVIVSEDGLEWESAVVGDPILTANVPAVTTGSGSLLLLDTGEEIDPPPGNPVAIARHEEELLVVSGRSLWVGPGGWEQIPLDPPHGMSARDVYPLSVDGRLLAVGSDRGRVRLYEWQP